MGRSTHPAMQRKMLSASFLRNTDRTDGNARSSRSREWLRARLVCAANLLAIASTCLLPVLGWH